MTYYCDFRGRVICNNATIHSQNEIMNSTVIQKRRIIIKIYTYEHLQTIEGYIHASNI